MLGLKTVVLCCVVVLCLLCCVVLCCVVLCCVLCCVVLCCVVLCLTVQRSLVLMTHDGRWIARMWFRPRWPLSFVNKAMSGFLHCDVKTTTELE